MIHKDRQDLLYMLLSGELQFMKEDLKVDKTSNTLRDASKKIFDKNVRMSSPASL